MSGTSTPAAPRGATQPAAADRPGNTPRPVRRRRRRQISLDKASFFAVALFLPLTVYVIFVISPFVQAVYFSMTDWSGFTADMAFVGLDNFVRLLGDDKFLRAAMNSALLAVVVPTVTIVIAIGVATMVTVGGSTTGGVRGLRGAGFYRVISFFPYCVPAIVIGLVWAQVYDPSRGLLNGVLTGIGLDGMTDFPWLGDPRTAMGASMFVIVWSFIGFYTVLFVAAIKGVPGEIYEAARLDGASRFRTAVSITVPLIRDNVRTAWIYLGIAAIDSFVYMQAMNPGGGPGYSTFVISQDLYQTAFAKGQFGYATAMGVVLALVTLLFAGAVFLVDRITGGRDDVRGHA
ncbi:carbohydrate ABC transporter permease [Myceligenerans xiligouense]|uniref:Carbohydrate ABC transporter membrane protein 1 (CUT1 family) n=1 Tax=Myceligenerans xiligouense TaxID=253184 RepID=A0A3N4ZJV9_9MICO|nr:sugar ABC transporter permease [Myceligenerans xiligouense]RPF20211.1 carbohydrate ABC transporter membrane protein 1 (CUT1 family) [Myceligenerans xiligouense]